MLATKGLTTTLSLQAKAHSDGSIWRRVLPQVKDLDLETYTG